MEIRSVQIGDINATVEALLSAFSVDPLMKFLFGSHRDQSKHIAEFFRILLQVRVRLGLPAFLAEEVGALLGAVMGNDLTRPAWSQSDLDRWSRLMGEVDGLESRLAEYGELAEKHKPAAPHFYLGVIGVREGRKGGGVGKALLEAFCERSARDQKSLGVYLETASEASLKFYLKNGFTQSGEGKLGKGTQLWCVFRATSGGAAA